MKLSIGIVGLPNVGKSTLFKSLTKNDIVVANYPFATIDPNVGVVSVPDKRLEVLSEMSASKKTIPAIVEFYDIAGLVKGAATGAGLGNKFLSHIRDVAAVVHVVRCFENDEIIHVDSSVNPLRDLEVINTELGLKDIETIDKRIGSADKEARSGDKEAKKLVEVLTEIKQKINTGESVTSYNAEPLIKSLGLLTTKPRLYLLNGTEEIVTEELKAAIKKEGSEYVVIDLSEEVDLTNLITKAYEILGLMSFFTTGEDETRAWTTEKGSTAPEAAGVIHTDFEEKFIRAEVVSYEDFVAAGGWGKAKQKGRLRTEGKDYVIKEGDIMNILHS